MNPDIVPLDSCFTFCFYVKKTYFVVFTPFLQAVANCLIPCTPHPPEPKQTQLPQPLLTHDKLNTLYFWPLQSVNTLLKLRD